MRHHPPRRSDEYQLAPAWKAELRGYVIASIVMCGLMAVYAAAAWLAAA